MSRELLLLLLGACCIEPFAFDDDDDGDDSGSDDDTDGDDTDDDDSSDDGMKKDDAKKKDDGKSEKKSKSETPEALRAQITELQRKLSQKNKRIATLSRERASLRRESDLKRKSKSDEDDDGDESETAKLRQTVKDLTDRLDNISSENFIEKNVIRKLQPLVAAGLDDDEADRKLNAAMRLVDAEEDFDDDGNFDAKGFLEKYPYLAVEADTKQETARDRLLGGSGNKTKSKKNYAADALKKFNERRNRKAGNAK